MAPARIALLALAAAAAPASALRQLKQAPDDDFAFGGMVEATREGGSKVQELEPATLEPECACLPWVKVYDDGVRCGDKFEQRGLEECEMFFRRNQEAMCVNKNDWKGGQEHQPQWCYVSSDCQRLRGGAVMRKAPLAWKECGPKLDPITSNWPVQKTLEWARANDMQPTIAASLFYPHYLSQHWEQVSQAVTTYARTYDLYPMLKLKQQHREQIVQLMKEGRPLFFNSKSKKPPQAIVQGHTVYVTVENTNYTSGKPWEEKYQHPFQIDSLTLVSLG